MKYLFALLLCVIISGCSDRALKTDIPNTKPKIKSVAIIPKDAYPFQFDGSHIIIQA